MSSTFNLKIISIEGNIGSGKSTLLENLKKYYENNPYVRFLKEPVDDWEKIKDKQGNTMLHKFYGDQEKYSFPFQMMAYISRLAILRNEVENIYKHAYNNNNNNNNNDNNDKSYVIITERSLYTDREVFAKMLFDQGKIEDVCYQIYLHWFDEFIKDYKNVNSVYVITEPQKCYERIHKRARVGEEFIPLSYLEDCHQYHNRFLEKQTNKLELDGNVDIYENKKIVEQWLGQIDCFINKNLIEV
jgi:deoxyadenosine/deoxycytidine kinase